MIGRTLSHYKIQDKRHVVLDCGHVPPRIDMIKETLDWLDRYLGPVEP